jgi:hypothetical protein
LTDRPVFGALLACAWVSPGPWRDYDLLSGYRLLLSCGASAPVPDVSFLGMFCSDRRCCLCLLTPQTSLRRLPSQRVLCLGARGSYVANGIDCAHFFITILSRYYRIGYRDKKWQKWREAHWSVSRLTQIREAISHTSV